jgi:hypothetical protein
MFFRCVAWEQTRLKSQVQGNKTGMEGPAQSLVLQCIVNADNQWGLQKDMAVFQDVLGSAAKEAAFKLRQTPERILGNQVRICGPYEMPVPASINIHFEIVATSFMHSAAANVLVVNQEWFYEAWVPSLLQFDAIWAKTRYAEATMRTALAAAGGDPDKVQYIGWTAPSIYDASIPRERKCVYAVGASLDKVRALKNLFAAGGNGWPATLPPLTITVAPDILAKREPQLCATLRAAANVTLVEEHLKDDECAKLRNASMFHLVLSEADGYGIALAEARSCGAGIVAAAGQPWEELLASSPPALVVHLPTDAHPVRRPNRFGNGLCLGNSYVLQTPVQLLAKSVTDLFGLDQAEYARHSVAMRDTFAAEANAFRLQFIRQIWPALAATAVAKSTLIEGRYLPPPVPELTDAELPRVTILTPTRNRRNFFGLAVRNFWSILYPPEKLEWVILDNSDAGKDVRDLAPVPDSETGEIAKEKIELLRLHGVELLGNKTAATIKYRRVVPRIDVAPRISDMRNQAISYGTGDVFVYMDDDDYYPPESVRARINALNTLTRGDWTLPRAVACTAIGLYHITKYSSAISVPPLSLGLSQRISEATLAHTRAFSAERAFAPATAMAEGEAFFKDRESQVRELPWQGVIVSLLHPYNSSDRRVHAALNDSEPNGCHFGFSDELFTFVSSLV